MKGCQNFECHSTKGAPTLPALALLPVLALTTACLGAPAEEDVGSLDRSALRAHNGVRLDNGFNLDNGFRLDNGVRLDNGINFANGIDWYNGINMPNGVMEPPGGSDLEKWIDADPRMRRRVLKYLAQCALPSTSRLTLTYRGGTYRYYGVAGLAPGWQSDSGMSVVEQEAVTSCMLARINGSGGVLDILLQGRWDNGGLNDLSSWEYDDYPRREAVFFGNLFMDPPRAYAAGGDDSASTYDYEAICNSRLCSGDMACENCKHGKCECGVLDVYHTFTEWTYLYCDPEQPEGYDNSRSHSPYSQWSSWYLGWGNDGCWHVDGDYNFRYPITARVAY